jgi:hypothetical protein
MPVLAEHVVAITESRTPPNIGRIVGAGRKTTDITLDGQQIVHESVLVKRRLPSGQVHTGEEQQEALRPATSDDLFQPGQFVKVPADQSGDAVFLDHGDPEDAIPVKSPSTQTGSRNADIARIELSDDSRQSVPYAEISPAV